MTAARREPSREADDEQRLAVVEAALGAAGAAGEMGDLVAQVLGVREHRREVALGTTVDVLQPDRVVSVHHDVGDPVDVEQRLELAGVEVGRDRAAG